MNLQKQKIFDGRVIRKKAEPVTPEAQMTHALGGVAVAAGLAGAALAATSIVLEIPLAMGLAAGLALLGAGTGLKGLSISYKAKIHSEKRQGPPDRRHAAEELAAIR